MATKTDERAAERLLNKVVYIGRCHAVLAKTPADRQRVITENAARFHNAVIAAALLVEEPATNGQTPANSREER